MLKNLEGPLADLSRSVNCLTSSSSLPPLPTLPTLPTPGRRSCTGSRQTLSTSDIAEGLHRPFGEGSHCHCCFVEALEGAVVVEHSLVVCASEALAVLHWERLRKPDMMTGSHAAAKTAILFQP